MSTSKDFARMGRKGGRTTGAPKARPETAAKAARTRWECHLVDTPQGRALRVPPGVLVKLGVRDHEGFTLPLGEG